MNNPETLKIVLYTTVAVCSLAGSVLGVGVWIGKKNQDSERIQKLENLVKLNEEKAKSRLYTSDGSQVLMRADLCEKIHTAMRADLSKLRLNLNQVEKNQSKYESTLESIDSNIKMLIGLFKDVVKH